MATLAPRLLGRQLPVILEYLLELGDSLAVRQGLEDVFLEDHVGVVDQDDGVS